MYIMAAMFSDQQGVLLVEFLKLRTPKNAADYCETLEIL